MGTTHPFASHLAGEREQEDQPMKRTLRTTLLLTAVSAAPLAAQAVMNPPPPPPVLWVQRELVKAGKGPAHNDYEAGWPAAFGKANWPTNYLGANALTGSNEAWFFIGYPSFEAMEKDLAQSDANASLSADLKRLTGGDSDYLESSSAVLLQYMPNLSYKPVVEIPKMRYFEILRYAVKPGHEGDFVKAATIYKDGFTKAGIDNHWATYRVVSGMPAGTFLVIIPMRSLSMFDRTGAEDEAMARALGPEQMGALGKLVSDGFATIQSQLFAFNPKMSYVSKEWKAADPFWR
jgi:hypothetical protein